MKDVGIYIVCSNTIKINDIEELCFGIEEEEVPYKLIFSHLKRIHKDLYTNSKSEIGIGISSEGDIILNQKKYSKDFILKEDIKSSKIKLRILGQNAARILKGLPLKK